MDEWTICTIENNKRYYLKKVKYPEYGCVWTSSLRYAIRFETKGLAQYFAATRYVRKYHIIGV